MMEMIIDALLVKYMHTVSIQAMQLHFGVYNQTGQTVSSSMIRHIISWWESGVVSDLVKSIVKINLANFDIYSIMAFRFLLRYGLKFI